MQKGIGIDCTAAICRDRPILYSRAFIRCYSFTAAFGMGTIARKGRLPKSKLDYWRPKIEANKERDLRSIAALSELGWNAAVVWQCELRDIAALMVKLDNFLLTNSVCA